MASLSSLPSLIASKNSISPSLSPFSKRTNQSSKPPNPKHSVHYIPCRANSNGDQNPNFNSKDEDSPSKLDRRDMLLGLGGLYGVATLGTGRSAMANPVKTPNISNCGPSQILEPGTGKFISRINCCPPSPDDIIDFSAPRNPPLRLRKPAHLLNKEEIAKFEKAVGKMKSLDKSDPRSFTQQAKIHCAYCNVGYEQEGFPGLDLQVHENWLFFPFHRWYLYFFERILGDLIDDPTFALPYWNWDAPDGMKMPAIYDKKDSPLYDELRNQLHRPPTMLDLNYDGTEKPNYDIKNCNLSLMHRQMITNARTAEQFLGKPIRAGEPAASGMGSIENIPHSNIHFWGGSNDEKKAPNGENLGNFYSAGNDILFYGLHGNVDRMWSLWKQLGNGKHRDFSDKDWLDSTFVFYDETKQAVRVKVGGCLDNNNQLGYVYEDAPIPWLNFKPKPSKQKKTKPIIKPAAVIFPVVLDSKLTTTVKRPKKSRSRKEKEEYDEMLVIEGIQFDRSNRIHFDVLVNVVDDEIALCPANSEFVGSFANVPHLHKHVRGEHPKTSLSLSITKLLEDLECEDDDTVVVTLDPKVGEGKVTIGDIKIQYLYIL